MSFLTASSPVPFGQRRRTHPALRLAAATFGSLAVIYAGWGFLSETVSQVAASAPLPRTDRETWYVPVNRAPAAAAELDIARSMPVKVELPASSAVPDGFTRKVGVEVLKVRSGPAKASDQVFVLKGGTPVSVGETHNGWVEITTRDGRSGWVFARFLNPAQG